MGTVVLMEYSTSGKSTILKDLKKRWGDCLQTIDTDDQIASDFGNHIYNVYLQLTKRENRQKALDQPDVAELFFPKFQLELSQNH